MTPFEIILISAGCAAVYYKVKRNRKHKFTVFLVKEGKNWKEEIKGKEEQNIYIPWVEKEYENEDEIEFDQQQMTEIALNPRKNIFFRHEGVIAFAFGNKDGEIEHLVMLVEK